MIDVNQIPIMISSVCTYLTRAFKMKFLWITVIILLISHNRVCRAGANYSTLTIHDQYFTVEIADTPKTIERGLMDRRSLAQNAGMLFVFKNSVKPAFWMKNTYVSLDLVFISEQGKVLCLHPDAEPLSLTRLTCPLACKAVLEINAGIIRQLNIQPGDFIHHDIFKQR